MVECISGSDGVAVGRRQAGRLFPASADGSETGGAQGESLGEAVVPAFPSLDCAIVITRGPVAAGPSATSQQP